MRSIEWNEKSARLLSDVQRDAYQRGEEVTRLDGELVTDKDGIVWLYDGHGNERILGYEVHGRKRETDAQGERSASDGKPSRKPRKRRK